MTRPTPLGMTQQERARHARPGGLGCLGWLLLLLVPAWLVLLVLLCT